MKEKRAFLREEERRRIGKRAMICLFMSIICSLLSIVSVVILIVALVYFVFFFYMLLWILVDNIRVARSGLVTFVGFGRFISYIKPVETIRIFDPHFNEEEFQEFVLAMIKNIQYAKAEEDLQWVKRYSTKKGFQQLLASGVIGMPLMISGEAVFNFKIMQIRRFSGLDHIDVELTEKEDIFSKVGYEYSVTLVRKAAMQTKHKIKSYNCKSCGAPLSAQVQGRCDYCGVLSIAEVIDWKINEFYLTKVIF